MKHMHKNISMLLLILVSILFTFVGCSDMMATAALAEKSYTVTFDSQAETTDADPTSKTVTSPATTIEGLPTAPEKTGYTFGGWFTEEAGGGTEFIASTEVLGDMTVYAKWTAYTVGDTGPAGGLVFYDNPNYETDGWRYLEAAPTDLLLGDSSYPYIFGYYRTTPAGSSVAVGGTGTGIGTGKANTAALVAAMESTAYISSTTSTTTTTGDYAARLCDLHEAGGYGDWFLPSKDELNQMYKKLKENDLGSFSDYTYGSSSESGAGYAEAQYFSNGYQFINFRDIAYRVRPVRAF